MPEAAVAKVTLCPGQFVTLLSAVATVGLLTVSVAVFVTELHAPLTSIVYVPASALATDPMVRDDVALLCAMPFFFQT